MGRDYWIYGRAHNRDCIDTMCRYSFEQGITARQMRADEVFPIPAPEA